MTRHFQVIFEFDPDEDVWATYVPALDMMSTYGETREEALAMTEEAIAGYLEVAAQHGISVPGDMKVVELVDLDIVT